MSDFKIEVVPITLEPHPNADTLSLAKVFGWQVVVKTEEWSGQPLGVYIPPESIVPDDERFAFLEGKTRIKARRFRGEWSFGLLMVAPPGVKEGDDLAEAWGITHYEPPIKHSAQQRSGGARDVAIGPPMRGQYYDIQNFRRWSNLFVPGEQVRITEKMHGCNARFTYQDGMHHVASRTYYRAEWWFRSMKGLKNRLTQFWNWLKRTPKEKTYNDSFYWSAYKDEPELMQVVQEHPDLIFYGEIYGNVQEGFPYESSPAIPYRIRIFDVFDPRSYNYLPDASWREWLPSRLCAPIDYDGPYSEELVEEICGRPSQLTDKHIREGCVIKPVPERRDPKFGRVILKCVNPVYLEKL